MSNLAFHLSILVPLFLLITIPIRVLTLKQSVTFPLTVFLFPISFIIGTMIYHIPIMQPMAVVATVPADLLLGIYLPVYIFSTVYKADQYIFIRCLPQVIIISTGIFIGMCMVLGALVRDILHHHLTYGECMIAALLCVPIQPNNIIAIFKDLAKYKYLGTMLEVESLLTLIPVTICLQLSFGYLDGIQSKWYQYVCVLIRYCVLSFLLGYVIGKITAKLMAWYYNIPKSVLTISIVMTYLTYFLAENLIITSGALALTVVSCIIKRERHMFTGEVENCMVCFWKIIRHKWEKVFLMLLGVITSYYFWVFFEFQDMFSSIITYFCSNIVRFIMFILLYPIMNILRYNMDVKCLLVLGWSGVKGSVNLMLLFILLTHRTTTGFTQIFFLEFMVYSYLSMFLNSASMKLVVSLLGMSELSNTRKSNMDNCLQYIMQKRMFNINIFKLNRYFSDANWGLVRRETVVKHPYSKANEEVKTVEEEEEEEEEGKPFQRTVLVCPDCVKEVPYYVSEKEIKEMIKEAHIKVLKAKKVSIIKQYENGVINKSCLQMLVYTFETMIESNSPISNINLDSYLKKHKFLAMLHYIMNLLNEETIHEPPNSLFKRLCFYIVMHKAYNYIIYAYNLIFVIFLTVNIYEEEVNAAYELFTISTFLFTLEMIIKTLALSRINISQGLSLYFKFKWNIYDFVLLNLSYVECVCMLMNSLHLLRETYELYVPFVIAQLRLCKFVILLQPLYSCILETLEYWMDSKICFGYDLALALVNCCDDVLLMIGHIIEVSIIKSFFVKQLQLEKSELIKIMEDVQSERPYIAITVKTKQAIRTTLNAMQDSLNDLKVSGYVDTVEYVYIFKEIFDKQKFLRNLKFVQPSPPKLLFFEVPWMVDDEKVKEFLFIHAEKVFWNKGEVICKDGRTPHGIYVFFGGLLKLKYTPKTSTLENVKSLGNIPIVDYYATLKFDEPWEDRITAGNSVGELSFLTGRPYNCTIVADSSSQAYFLTTEVINRAMKLSKHPINGLEARMWKCSIINLAIAVLANVPLYQMLTPEQIKFKLQRAFMPNLSCYKMFVMTDMMDDVILMEGMAADYNYGHIFVAPMHLPRTTQKLILPKSSYLDVDDKIIAKLLVIPVANADEIEIMMEEEELAEFVRAPSSSCLLRLNEDHVSRENIKLHRQINVEPILSRPSYYSLSMFEVESKDKFEVIDPAPSTSDFATVTSDDYELKLITVNKTLAEADLSDQNLN